MPKFKSLIETIFVGLALFAGSVNAEILVYEPFVGAPGDTFTSVETESVNLGPWSEPTFTGNNNNGAVVFVDLPAYTDGIDTLPARGAAAALRRDVQSPSAELDAPVTFVNGESAWIGFQGGLRDDGGSNFDRQFSWLRFGFSASNLEVYWDTRTYDNAVVALELTGAGGTNESDETIPYPPVGDPLNEFVLIRIDFKVGAETIHLWRNPSLWAQPADGDALLVASQELGNTLSTISARSNAYHTQLVLDEIRIGSTFDDAVGREGPNTSARLPQPANRATDVLRDVVLSWTPAELAVSHNVYVGASFEDVNAATLGSNLFKANQTEPTCDLGRLEMETTYYWRVDEISGPPEATTYKGSVWSFSTESRAYPIVNVTATASSNAPLQEAQNTVNGSGLDDSGLLHGNASAGTMWLSNLAAAEPSWIEYEFDRAYRLHEMRIWNFNESWEQMIGLGIKEATIEYSTDAVDYTTVGTTHEFAQGPGAAGYAHNTTVDLSGITARYVKITANSNWGGGILNQYGLSEVRFSYIPVEASDPSPASGATGVDLDATVGWRPGREAGLHEVYFSTDRAAVEDGTAPVASLETSNFKPEALEYGQTYYWKVNEVNDAAATTVVEGELWEFSTVEDLIVEDFEGYTDNDANNEAIWQAWIDGFGVAANGSQVGYVMPPYAELAIVHGGKQSMPLSYDNSAGATISEATMTPASPQDWTVRGLGELSVWFRGYPASLGGFAEAPAGTFTVTAAGADIWNQADEFHYLYQQLTGAGSISARVDSVENTHPWAKSGVMIRETLDPESAFAAVYMTPTNPDGTPTNGARFQARADTGGSATSDTSVATDEQKAVTAPYWVKIERDLSGTFRGYYSADGAAWTPMAWRPAISTMSSTVYIGLALTSHVTGVRCRAVFSGVATEGNVTGQWQSQDIGILSNSAEPLYVELAGGGASGVVLHDDPAATQIATWTRWRIDLQQFADQGVDLTGIDSISIGVGDKVDPRPGGWGIMYFDDILLSRLSRQPQP